MSIDCFLDRRYDKRHYNCTHFAAEVWSSLTGEDVYERLDALIRAATGQASLTAAAVRRFAKRTAPISPSLVLMQRRGTEPHLGVYVRGRILHITERGVEFFLPDVATRGFEKVSYFQ